MASLTKARSGANDTQFGLNLSSAVNKVAGRIVTWNEARITRKALSKLSEHQLNDIGLSRSDIHRFH